MSTNLTFDENNFEKEQEYFINNNQDEFYQDDDGLLERQVSKVNSILGNGDDLERKEERLITTTPEIRLQEFESEQPTKRNSHLYSSVDDITRDSPIRRSSCTSCALCEANARDLNVKRNREGGFQLRKSASCSICTWDIEEFEFDDNPCDNTGDESEDSIGESLEEEEEEEEDEDEEEEKLLNGKDLNDGPEDTATAKTSGRQRSNSYTKAMDDDSHLDLLEGDHNFSLSQRLPPDGGEIVDETVENDQRTFNHQDKKNIRASSPKAHRRGFTNRPKFKGSGIKNQKSIDKKISQELDEIFGKLHRSPHQSFEHGEDTFDLNDSNNISINSSRGSSKRGSFRKLIKTPSFLKRHKKTKLDVSKSRSVEFLYVSEPVVDYDMKKSVSTMDVSTYYQDLEEEDSENLEINVNEAFIEYLDNIGGTVLFSGNEILRFLWHQITTYQHELVGPFDDFMKSVLDEIQQAYKKCQDLEAALSQKVQQQERVTSKIYEDAETALRQEREQLQHKHIEKEDQIKTDLLRIIKSKENELQDLVKRNNELVSREDKLTNENHEIKQVLEKLEDQYGLSTSNEANLQERSESLKTENFALIEKLKYQEDALQHLHDQLIQSTNNATDSRENYDKLVRRFKDLNEEKEQLEASCSNLTSDLEELKTYQHKNSNSDKAPSFDKQLSWSTTSSIDLGDRAGSPVNRSSLSIEYEVSYNRSLTDSTSYNKATDSVLFLTRQSSRACNIVSSTPSFDIDERNRYIQTPSGMTALRSQESFDQQQQPRVETDRAVVHDSSRRNYTSDTPIQNNVSASKRRLLYENQSAKTTPIRLASNQQNEFKVIFTGDSNVGKTSLIRRICQGTFKETRESTIEMDCGTKIVDNPQCPVTLRLWDTVGTEKFNSIPASYFRKSDIVVLVYDIHDEGSFFNARKWIRQIHDYTNEDIFLFLIGNKSDLHHQRVVAPKRAECLAEENDAIYIETSAKTAENTDKLCELMASTMLEREETVFIRNDFERTLCSLSYSHKRKNEVSICCS